MDDEVGSLVEKLKPQFVTKWLKTVCDVRFDVMVMCLLPKPMEFARVRIIVLDLYQCHRETYLDPYVMDIPSRLKLQGLIF